MVCGRLVDATQVVEGGADRVQDLDEGVLIAAFAGDPQCGPQVVQAGLRRARTGVRRAEVLVEVAKEILPRYPSESLTIENFHLPRRSVVGWRHSSPRTSYTRRPNAERCSAECQRLAGARGALSAPHPPDFALVGPFAVQTLFRPGPGRRLRRVRHRS
jgi:hypothetical protein